MQDSVAVVFVSLTSLPKDYFHVSTCNSVRASETSDRSVSSLGDIFQSSLVDKDPLSPSFSAEALAVAGASLSVVPSRDASTSSFMEQLSRYAISSEDAMT